MGYTDMQLSKFLCVLLRHDPSAAGLTVNEHGWADVGELIDCVSRTGWPIDRETLERIVREDDKSRYCFSADRSMIRCNHGHTFPVDLELPAVQPPETLLHGTGDGFAASIEEKGLLRKTRMYVHLTEERATAVSVGARHGRPVIFCVRSGELARDGYEFFRSASGIWLTDHVPAKYLEKME